MARKLWTAHSDEALLDASREGDAEAFSVLWERHRGAGVKAARGIAPRLDADDLVSEAYLKIFELVRDGRGPRGAFRPYLYQVIRTTAADWWRIPEDASDALEEIPDLHEAGPWEDGAFDLNAAAEAFGTLTPRWQAVLWYTEVEGMPPREAAKLLGLSANGVSALAKRAREALQSAWVEAHVNRELAAAACQTTLQNLQRYQRGKLTAAVTREVEAHLDICDDCRKAAAEYSTLNRQLALVIAAVLLGVGPGSALLSGVLAPTAASAAVGAGSATAGGATAGGATAGASLPAVITGAAALLVVAVGGTAIALAAANSGQTDPFTPASPPFTDAAPGGDEPRAQQHATAPPASNRSKAASDISRASTGPAASSNAESGASATSNATGDPAGAAGSSASGDASASGGAGTSSDASADTSANTSANGDASAGSGANAAASSDSTADSSTGANGGPSSSINGTATAAANGGSDPEGAASAAGSEGGANATGPAGPDGTGTASGTGETIDPSLSPGHACWKDNGLQGQYFLEGVASGPGSVFTRVTSVEGASETLAEGMQTQSGNEWWSSYSLVGLLEEKIPGAVLLDSTVEVRLEQANRYSPWTRVDLAPENRCPPRAN